ncbi:MAG: UvrB/UvrC motif-containing protein [Thermoleophilia bacterium]|nr:UvrB/UvrC motif-containing protein [Thermoleophilia bacterium]
MAAMQLRLDAADRLVELVEERRSPVAASEAARSLFALANAPAGLARSLLDDVVSCDARLTWSGGAVALAGDGADLPLDAATYVVVDLETTGLSPRTGEICEIGAVRLRGLEPAATFQTLVGARAPLPRPIAALTGISPRALRDAPHEAEAVRRFLAFAGAGGDVDRSVLVAHNARFDLAFLDRAVGRVFGRRLAGPVVDTVALARALLGGRTERTSLASLARFFGTATEPCHRALPDAQATAEVLVRLLGLAQERGATTVGDVSRLAAPRARRAHEKRALVFGAPARPGVYLFRGRDEQVLYVGRARDLRIRLRSYFRSERQRPAVEAALSALERVEWRVLGSELEAALEELRLLRELRPPANARSARPDRYLYVVQRGERLAVTSSPTALGPIRSRRVAELAVRALAGATPAELDRLAEGAPLPRLRARLRDLARARRYEEAARLRDRVAALEHVVRELRELERLRSARVCLLAPATADGYLRAFFLAGGRVAGTRVVPRGPGAELEIGAGLAAARAASAGPPALAPEHADELLLVGSFLRRPPPELVVVPLDEGAVLAACAGTRTSARVA